MQRIRSITRLLVSLVFLFCVQALPAQEYLSNDAAYPHRPLLTGAKSILPNVASAGASRTTVIAPFPFVDDFSYDSLFPSRAFWDLPTNGVVGSERVPGVSTRKSSAGPSKGTCSFDGATAFGELYEQELAFGMADSLTSLPFDLSAFAPGDSLYLSFYVQRGGPSDVPEASDSLVLSFDSSGTYQYERVWGLKGNGASDLRFRYVEIPIREARYFRNGFRFRFQNFGSLNGEFDVFHIDYVVLRHNRFAGDSAASDVSPYIVNSGPMGTVTAVPRDHFGLAARMGTPVVRVANVSTPAITTQLNCQISDPVGGNALIGSISQTYGPVTIQPGEHEVAILPGSFSEQASSFIDYGAIRFRSIVSAPGDQRPGNDTLDFYCGIDSVLGYDDGVSDGAYGLTTARSFCQTYRIPEPDTLTAVWIYFTPYLYYNSANGQSYSLANKNFRLSVWDTLVVDSFLVQTSTGMSVRYDSSLNSFNRYPLANPIVVDTLFWVGIRQIDGVPLGVGFDRNFGAAELYYEATNGDFVLSTNVGALMIRPEFGQKRLSVGQENSLPRLAPMVSTFPNPWREGELTLRMEGGEGVKGLRIKIYDLNGRVQFDQDWPVGSTTMHLPAYLRTTITGLNLLEVSGTSSKGETFLGTQRLLVQSME
jgi:hypothetical protein